MTDSVIVVNGETEDSGNDDIADVVDEITDAIEDVVEDANDTLEDVVDTLADVIEEVATDNEEATQRAYETGENTAAIRNLERRVDVLEGRVTGLEDAEQDETPVVEELPVIIPDVAPSTRKARFQQKWFGLTK